MPKTPDEFINEISAVRIELEKLGVPPERINLTRMSIDDLEVELDALSEQLKTRKRFLGVIE